MIDSGWGLRRQDVGLGFKLQTPSEILNRSSDLLIMAVKLTLIFFILICLEIGLLLVALPWLDSPSWSENFLLVWLVDRTNLPTLGHVVASGYFRGAVSGLGLLNIFLALYEAVNFHKTVRAFQSELKKEEARSE